MTIATTFAIAEVQTSPKGAKSAPLESEGKHIVWQSQWTSIVWEPSNFDKDQGPRQNVCFATERDSEAWAAWEDFEKRCVDELTKRWGSDVQDRWQSCLKESRQGATFLKCKLDSRNVRFWDADGNKIQRPETLAGCECKANVEARQVWIMGKQCGLVLDVRDLQVKLGTGGGSCPF